ncbi:hypothetical protein ACEPAH_1119 [Sanghuangporus vaninii]
MSVFAGRRRFILLVIFLLAFVYPTVLYWYEIQSTITIAARPLLSSPPDGPRQILTHYYAENPRAFGDYICELHGWSSRSMLESTEQQIWDAIILDAPTASEIDLLEIRLNELDNVVDKVFIVESNRTINGTPKGFYWDDRRWEERFLPFHTKIVYRAVPAPRIDSLRSPSPEAWSARLRSEMNSLLRTRSSNTRRPPVVLFSAPDEIPAAHTMRLLRDCKFPSPLHLQMRKFLYSFEWPSPPVGSGWDSWRAQVHVWDVGTRLEALGRGEARLARRHTEYSRERVSEFALADAGWHCTYCYKNLEDIIAKMQDDHGAEAASVTPEGLQEAICEGKDLFNNLPEAYTVRRSQPLLLKSSRSTNLSALQTYSIKKCCNCSVQSRLYVLLLFSSLDISSRRQRGSSIYYPVDVSASLPVQSKSLSLVKGEMRNGTLSQHTHRKVHTVYTIPTTAAFEIHLFVRSM